MSARVEPEPERTPSLESRLQVPVLVAAVISVPAVFLSALDGSAGTVLIPLAVAGAGAVWATTRRRS